MVGQRDGSVHCVGKYCESTSLAQVPFSNPILKSTTIYDSRFDIPGSAQDFKDDDRLADGWPYLSHDDLQDMVEIYCSRKKYLSFSKLGLPDIHLGDVYEGVPANFLADFVEAREKYYSDKCLTLYDVQDSRWLCLPVKVRGTYEYEKMVKRRFRALAGYAVSTQESMVFATFASRAPEGLSPFEMLKRWDGFVNSLTSFLYQRNGKRHHYVWAIEPTKRGYCHLHMIFFGCTKRELVDYDSLVQWWENKGMGDYHGVRLDEVHQDKETYAKVVGYLTKYLSKSVTDPFWSGMLALTRRREWGVSNGLSKLVQEWSENEDSVSSRSVKTNSKETKEYIVLGLLERLIVESILSYRSPSPDELLEEVVSIRATLHSLETDYGDL